MDARSQAIYKTLLTEAQNLADASVLDDRWEEHPVPLREFVTGSRYLNLPALTERQYFDLETFLGLDPKKVFDGGSQYKQFVLLAGKGSGKDYLASIILSYCLYILLCMKNPHEFLDWPIGEAIDMVIVSYSGDQAELVTFDKIKKRIENCLWFRSHFNVVLGDKPMVSGNKDKRQILIHQDKVVTFNNIRILSEHSRNESYEGYNILFFIMSESSAFVNESKVANANRIYATLLTSASTRFPHRFKGMIMSWPRYDPEVDFTIQLYEKNRSSMTIWTERVYAWDYKPARLYTGERFKFEHEGEIISIPVEHKEEFEKFPEDSNAKHLCSPARLSKTIIPISEISKAISDRPSLLQFEESIHDKKVRLTVRGLENRVRFIEDFLLTIDLGRTFAAAAIALQHWDPITGYVLDAIGAWTPDPKNAITVDMIDVEERIKEICNGIPRVRVGFDHWNSALYIARLKGMGFDAFAYEVKSLHGQDYDLLQKGIASNLVHLLNHKELLLQLSALRVDQKTGEMFLEQKIAKRKDHVDVVTGGFKTLLAEAQSGNRMGGTFIGNNLTQMGGMTIGRNI